MFSGLPDLTASVDGITDTIQGSYNLRDRTVAVVEVAPAESDNQPALDAGREYRTFILDADPQRRAFVNALFGSES